MAPPLAGQSAIQGLTRTYFGMHTAKAVKRPLGGDGLRCSSKAASLWEDVEVVCLYNNCCWNGQLACGE